MTPEEAMAQAWNAPSVIGQWDTDDRDDLMADSILAALPSGSALVTVETLGAALDALFVKHAIAFASKDATTGEVVVLRDPENLAAAIIDAIRGAA